MNLEPFMPRALALLCAFSVRAEPQYRIAFSRFAPRSQEIFLADSNGANARLLAPHTAFNWNASFSPDGQWVVFTSTRAGSADLFRIRLDGSGLERLTDSLALDDRAAFSPDGGSIAFVSSRTGQADIWILDLKTRRLVNLTKHPEGRIPLSLVAGRALDRLLLGSRFTAACAGWFQPSTLDRDIRDATRWDWFAPALAWQRQRRGGEPFLVSRQFPYRFL